MNQSTEQKSRKSPNERFRNLAEKRVVKAIKQLRLIGNLANRSNYAYSDEEVAKIISALDRELRDLRRKFEAGGPDGEISFRL